MNAIDRWDSLIQYYAEKHQLPWKYVKRQVAKESSGNSAIKNKVTGALGLMQLMPDTAKWLCTKGVNVKDPLHPEQNLDGGCWYMAFLLARVGLRFEENHYTPVSVDDLYRMALTGYVGGAAYVYRALAQLHARDSDLDWTHVLGELPEAKVNGKTIRVADVDDYVRAILPWEGGAV